MDDTALDRVITLARAYERVEHGRLERVGAYLGRQRNRPQPISDEARFRGFAESTARADRAHEIADRLGRGEHITDEEADRYIKTGERAGEQPGPRFSPGDHVTFDIPSGHQHLGNLHDRQPATVLSHNGEDEHGHKYNVMLHDQHSTHLRDVREHRLSPTGPVVKDM